MKLNSNEPKAGRGNSSAFTLIELVVMIAIFGLLLTILSPVLANTKTNRSAFQCKENQRRLMLAWQLYSNDQNDRMIPVNSWISSTLDWSLSTQNFDATSLLDSNRSLIAPYVKSATVFKCPADEHIISGSLGPRVRSYSMNAAVGGRVGTIGGNYDPDNPSTPRTYIQDTRNQTISVLNKPGPAKVWVILDEQADSISDAIFQFQPGRPPPSYTWQDLPGSYHNGGVAISFADGHSEIHKWKDPRTQKNVIFLWKWWEFGSTYPVPSTPVTPNPDYPWMNQGMPYF